MPHAADKPVGAATADGRVAGCGDGEVWRGVPVRMQRRAAGPVSAAQRCSLKDSRRSASVPPSRANFAFINIGY